MNQNFGETKGYVDQQPNEKQMENMVLNIWDGMSEPQSIFLRDFHKKEIIFGRDDNCDIVLRSRLVSHRHGRICFRKNQWIIEDKAAYEKTGSTNGLIYNNRSIVSRNLCDGDFIRIDDGRETIPEGVLFIFSVTRSQNQWKIFWNEQHEEITIGRDSGNQIVLPHISVSKFHAKIVKENGRFYIIDLNSRNGVIVNNVPVNGKASLNEKDVIAITNTKLIFTKKMISYCCFAKGISVDTSDVVIIRKRGFKKNVTGNHISLNVKPGELVAIIGGSGAGKSTILNCMCGYLPPEHGSVYINGTDLYKNFHSLKNLIGYVPQSDIVYDNLTLQDMLSYTAKLRLPKDTTVSEKNQAIENAIELVELSDKKNSLIRSLSGGQKKRASIAVELLSDPNLLFLDEPASGLDPGTERTLMLSLRNMVDNGKTVILVTHSTLQLSLCDKIAFMGKGGNLCFYGSLEEAYEFFGVSDVVDIYNMITDEAQKWKRKYEESNPVSKTEQKNTGKMKKIKKKNRMQLPVLCARYTKLVLNDRMRLLFLLLQAPILAALISLVADGQEFQQYEMTKSLLFALSCSAFWVGMLNAIQEICKERSIVRREYMTGLSMTSYVLSKVLVLGILSAIQSVLLVGVFSVLIGLPDEGILTYPFIEIWITTFLTTVASVAMGLVVSAIFQNADRAMTIAPILLMPQILFSGLIFKLAGVTESISWFAICRWSMEGYGTTANLNELPMKLQQQGIEILHEAEDFFEFTEAHMWKVWGILLLFTVAFLMLARIALSTIGKEKN